MPEWKLNTPVAFLIFNRPETTARVFSEIARAKPPKLLVVADGPRVNHFTDVANCRAARAIIEQVDWDCEVLTNYSDNNLGCKNRVSSGLSWVFDQVPEAIFLEDDCLPHPTFFRYCEELLDRYRNDERIGMICGTNLVSNIDWVDSYYFSRFPHIWGWASWHRVWQSYDVEMKGLEDLLGTSGFSSNCSNRHEHEHWKRTFRSVASGRVNTWDAQVTYMAFKSGMLSIFPRTNLISNIGFDSKATHTKNSGHNLSALPTHELKFPLRHVQIIEADSRADSLRRSVEGIDVSFFAKALRYFNSRLARVVR